MAKNLIKKDLNKIVFVEKRVENRIKNDFSKIKNFKIKKWKKKFSSPLTVDQMNIL